MRVAICWAGISGYMAACWRELAARGVVDPIIIAVTGQRNSAFSEQLLSGLNYRLLPARGPGSATAIKRLIADHKSELVTLPGWIYRTYRKLAGDADLQDLPIIMVMDTPLTRGWRQRLARIMLGSYLRRMSRVVVPGERSWQLARYFGVREEHILRATYGIDFDALAPVYARRASNSTGWPRRLLYAGRYVVEKGVDVLVEAYRLYREQVPDPWTLTCCGMGPLGESLARQPGIENLGFLQPRELVGVMSQSGALVLASRYDPWPLIVVEACATGLPVVCTEACGSSVELVRSMHNGLTVASNDAVAFARGLIWIHHRYDCFPVMGRRGQELAAAYSAQRWADRWEHMCGEVLNQSVRVSASGKWRQ
jgi:glycosyltransferase involved in cell wall biosynthesis